MKSQSMLSKALVLIFATLIVNQMACNKASFEASKGTPGQTAPAPDNVDDPFDQSDSGDIVRCDNSSDLFCDRGDDGLTDDVPPLDWNPPQCSVSREGNCFSNTCTDTRRNPIKGVDVWLVVDSSRSFDDERVAVGRALADGFIRDLVQQVPVRISVIVGHAPSGPYAGVGSGAPAVSPSIFYRHGSEPFTITINQTSEINSKREQLLSKLRETMRESPISMAKRNRSSIEYLNNLYASWPLAGPHSGADELGLRNFTDALQRASVPRDNAWVVLFMSDENDACTPFDSPRASSPYQVNGHYYSHPSDEEEMKRWYCNGITTARAYTEAVRFAGSRPFALGALVYTGQAAIPGYAHPQASVGKGYTEVVANAGRQGVMIDLASQDFLGLQTTANRLVGELAEITNESVGTHTQFPIYDRPGNNISLNQVATIDGRFNMQVFVDGRRTNYTVDSKNSYVRPSTLGSEVEIRFCLK